MQDLRCNAGDGKREAGRCEPHTASARPSQTEDKQAESHCAGYNNVSQVEENKMRGNNSKSKGGGGKDQRLTAHANLVLRTRQLSRQRRALYSLEFTLTESQICRILKKI
jgi:hypothetical protein